jgi:hypothetical protein
MVPLYIFILSTVHPLGTDVVVMDVIFELLNVVVPLSPGFDTMIPLAGTLNEYSSLLLHDTNDNVAAVVKISANVINIFFIKIWLLRFINQALPKKQSPQGASPR